MKSVTVTDPYTFNLDLARTTGPYNCFVIVSDSAGEWLYSAGAFAYAKKCAILLLSNKSIDRIIDFVPKDAEIYLVGYNGKRLKNTFPNATVVFTGSKAEDAVKIANMFPTRYSQVYIVSGMYLYLPVNPRESPIWTGGGGKYPVLIAYPDEIPKVTEDFILSKGIAAAVFIGPELDKVFGEFRNKVGNTIITKELINIGFQGVPTRQSGVPYPLPVLLLPSGDVKIDLESVSALVEGKIFLTFRNLGDAAGFVLPTYIKLTCGDLTFEPAPPENPVVVYGRDSTIVEIDLNDTIPQSGCTLYLEGRYGSDAKRLLFEFNKTLSFKPNQIEDPTKLSVERVVYSPRLEAFVLYLKNESNVRAYATPELLDVLVDGIPTTFKGRMGYIEPGSTGKLYVKAVLTDADLIDNPEVKVLVRYGKYRNLPIKTLSGTYALEKETLTDVVIEFVQENTALVLVALALIIIILLILRRR